MSEPKSKVLKFWEEKNSKKIVTKIIYKSNKVWKAGKIMNETKKIVTILIVAVIAVVGVIGLNVVSQKENEKLMETYDNLMASKEAQLIYIARPTCSYCQQFQPILEEITGMYDMKYQYMNTDEINSSTLTKLLNKFNTDSSTPQLLIVKDGKVVDTQNGYTDREGLFKFLQENGLIDKEEVLEANDAHLTKIDYEGYDAAINSDTDKLIVVAQTGCSYCEQAKPVLNQIAKDNEVEVNWLDITTLSEDEQAKVTNSLDIFSEDFGTPLIMIVKNNKVVDSIQGFESKEKYVTFLQDNDFIK